MVRERSAPATQRITRSSSSIDVMRMRRRAEWGIRAGLTLAACALIESVVGALTGFAVPVSVLPCFLLASYCYYFVARIDGVFGNFKLLPWMVRNASRWALLVWFLALVALVAEVLTNTGSARQGPPPGALLGLAALYLAATSILISSARLGEIDAKEAADPSATPFRSPVQY